MSSKPHAPPTHRGYAFGLGAVVAFVLMVTLVKVCREAGLSSRSIVFYRGFVVLPFCWYLMRGLSYQVKTPLFLVGRCIFGFLAMFTSFAAMKWINIIEINLLFNLQPILVAASAPIILGAIEKPDKRTLGALGVALCGSMIIIGPELTMLEMTSGNQRWVGLGLGAFGALCGALAHVCLRGLKTTPAIVTVTWFQASIAAVALIPFDTQPLAPLWELPDLVLPLIGVGLAALTGQLCLTRAYQELPAIRASALGYAAPVVGVCVDIVIFASWPMPHTLFGGALIITSGLWWLRPGYSGNESKTSALQ